MQKFWLLGWSLIVLTACSNKWSGIVGPISQQNPLIAYFQVAPNPMAPQRGPFELNAFASGMGTLSFTWNTNGGLLSVATESVAAATASLAPTMTLWQPPSAWGKYQVYLTVTDSGGRYDTRIAHFQVGKNGTRILSPLPSGLWFF